MRVCKMDLNPPLKLHFRLQFTCKVEQKSVCFQCLINRYQLWPLCSDHPGNGDHDEGPLNFDDVLWVLIGPTRVSETELADWTFPLTWDEEDTSQVQPEPGWHLDQLTSTCPLLEDHPPQTPRPPDPYCTNYLTYPQYSRSPYGC